MVYLELAIVVVLILINGLLAMAELAIVSSRRARLQILVERDVVGSRRALALHNDPGRFLSTVQIGITLVGVLSGAFSGATLGLRVGRWLAELGLPQAYAEPSGVALVVAAITYLSLIAGELVPKQIALRNPEAVAVRVAPAMTFIARIGAPLVWLLDLSGRALLRLLGQQAQPEGKVTDEEIRSLVAEAETAGVIEPGERSMITGVMRLGDRPVRAIMTSRRDVDMVDLSRDDETIRRTIVESIHSRMPVHDGAPDEILGVIQAKDLLNACLRHDTPDVRAHIRQAPTVPDTADAIALVNLIRETPLHMVLVHDEYGHFEGVVTNADILEFDRRQLPDRRRRTGAGCRPPRRRVVAHLGQHGRRRICRAAAHSDPGGALLQHGRRLRPRSAGLPAARRRHVRRARMALRDRRSGRPPGRQDHRQAYRRRATREKRIVRRLLSAP